MNLRSFAAVGLLGTLTAIVCYAEPSQAHLENASKLKEGLSTRDEAVRLLGNPMCENMVNGCAMCTWTDGKKSLSLQFDGKGILQDRKTWDRH